MPTLPIVHSNGSRPLGFSTGCLYRFFDTYSEEAIYWLGQQGLETIEVMCARIDQLDRLPAMVEKVKKFAVKSIHLPLKIQYANTPEIKDVLRRLEDFYHAIGASLVVVHPESIDDWSIFDDLSMNLAIENLDNRTPRWFGFEQFEKFLDERPDWSMVLDLNHCFTYPDSAELAKRYIDRFGDRIAEVHLSGCGPDMYHVPLYLLRQKEIVDCLPQTDCPIVIESPFDNLTGLIDEIDFIKSCV